MLSTTKITRIKGGWGFGIVLLTSITVCLQQSKLPSEATETSFYNSRFVIFFTSCLLPDIWANSVGKEGKESLGSVMLNSLGAVRQLLCVVFKMQICDYSCMKLRHPPRKRKIFLTSPIAWLLLPIFTKLYRKKILGRLPPTSENLGALGPIAWKELYD